jgi:hypothetical protein
LSLRNTGTIGTDKLRSFSSGTLGSKMGGSLPMLVRKILVKGTQFVEDQFELGGYGPRLGN